MRNIILSLVTFSGASCVSCVSVAAQSPARAVFPLSESFPQPTVPVRIGEHGPFTFILDTGAEGSVIDAALAEKLGLEVRGVQQIGSPLGEQALERPVVAFTGVSVGPFAIPDLEVPTLELSELLGGDGAPVGVLSPNDLGDRLVTFDLPAGRIEIADGALPEADGTSVFEYADHPHPTIPVQVGEERYLVHVDTGSPGGITLPLAVASELPLRGEPAVVGQARTVDATVSIWGATLEGSVRVGGVVLENPELRFIEGAPAGNVGKGFLAGCVLTIDASNRRLQLKKAPATEPGAAPAAATVMKRTGPKRYGIRFAGGVDGSPIPVAGVDDGSPAQAGGLRSGDLIEKLNGVGVSELAIPERISALKGSPLNLVVRRGEELVELSMSLE